MDNCKNPEPESRVYYPNECTITKVENGFILRFGCKTFIASTWAEASTGIEEYWEDPRTAHKTHTKSLGG